MPKPIFTKPNLKESREDYLLRRDLKKKAAQLTAKEKNELKTLLRKQRSKKYMEAVHNLDLGSHMNGKQKAAEIMAMLRDELPITGINGLVGIVSKCYLGDDFEVHTLSCTQEILEHFRIGQPLPDGMEKVRTLAKSDMYAFIEVYTDYYACVSEDGTVSVVER